jgi:hypothetical protein
VICLSVQLNLILFRQQSFCVLLIKFQRDKSLSISIYVNEGRLLSSMTALVIKKLTLLFCSKCK